VAATGTLSQAAGTAAVAASDVFTGAAFTASAVATTTLTVTGGNPQIANLDALTVGGTTYKFVTVLAAANDVLVGPSDTQSLLNLKAAINGAPGGSGVAYGIGTVANTNVNAGTATATTLVISANINGVGNGSNTGNSVASTLELALDTWRLLEPL